MDDGVSATRFYYASGLSQHLNSNLFIDIKPMLPCSLQVHLDEIKIRDGALERRAADLDAREDNIRQKESIILEEIKESSTDRAKASGLVQQRILQAAEATQVRSLFQHLLSSYSCTHWRLAFSFHQVQSLSLSLLFS